MKWNKEKILKLLDDIRNELENTSDLDKRNFLNNDICLLTKIYNIYIGVSESNNNLSIKVNEELCNNNYNFLKNHTSDFRDSVYLVCGYPRLPLVCSLKKMPSEEELISLNKEFFSSFDESLLTTFEELMKDERILMGDYPFGKSNIGLTYPISYDNSSFIWVKEKKNKYNMATLAHEVAHANILSNITTIKDECMSSSSIFKEVYSIIVGALFNEYVMKTKYHKLGLRDNVNYLDDFVEETDYLFGFLMSLDKVSYDKGIYTYGDTKISNDRLVYYISTLLANYLLELYDEDNEYGKKEISKLRELLIHNYDEEIIRNYDIKEMYKLSRKRVGRYR